VNLAAWSVNTHRDGTITLTLRQEDNAALLQRVLREAGVPAVVRFAEVCSPTFDKAAIGRVLGGGDGHPLTIRPSAIPHGADLLISSLPPLRVSPPLKQSSLRGSPARKLSRLRYRVPRERLRGPVGGLNFQLHPARQPLRCTALPPNFASLWANAGHR
jgi:hypothetical protein